MAAVSEATLSLEAAELHAAIGEGDLERATKILAQSAQSGERVITNELNERGAPFALLLRLDGQRARHCRSAEASSCPSAR